MVRLRRVMDMAMVTGCGSAAVALSLQPRTAVSWSNRLGLTLTPITTGMWGAERPFVWNSIDVGGRSAIARVPSDGSLLVHSPVEWTADLGACIDALGGGVGHIVAPNYEHLKYTQQWAEQYPEARVYACPDLPGRMPEVAFDQELKPAVPSVTSVAWAPESMGNDVECVWFDCEINPFTGKPFFNEVVMLHRPTKSLIVSDTFWNYPSAPEPNFDGQQGTGEAAKCPKVPFEAEDTVSRVPSIPVPVGTRLWKFGMDRVYRPFYLRFMVGSGERRAKFEQCVQAVLGWEVENIVPCHGDVVRGKELCRRVLTAHFGMAAGEA